MENNNNSNKTFNHFKIVNEQDRIITVSAADMRSEDELNFIDSINNNIEKVS